MSIESGSNSTPLNTVLFDLDGTILDTIELILSSYRHVRMEHLPEHDLDDDHFRKRLGVPLWAVFTELVGEGARVDELVDRYREHNRARHDEMVRPFSGIPDLLTELRTRGVRLGIVTSKMRGVTIRGLEISGLAAHFEVIVSVEEVTHHKPHPEPVVRALSELGADPARALFVGDAPADIGSGRAAGVRTGAALWGPFRRDELAPHGPDHFFDHPMEIIEALRG
jgi:pyrophosphatase PpaX